MEHLVAGSFVITKKWIVDWCCLNSLEIAK